MSPIRRSCSSSWSSRAPTRRRRPTSSARDRVDAAAYGLDDIDYVDYAQSSTGDEVDTAAALAELRNDTETIPNARLLDLNVLSATFTARQQIRNVYGFLEKLDIDRYTLPTPRREETTRDYVVPSASSTARGCRRTRTPGSTGTPSTRTATVSSPPRRTRSWPARRAASPTSTKDLPTTGNIEVDQPRIYYGELIQQGGQEVYSVVGAPEGARASEFDQPEDGSTRGSEQHLRRRGRGVDRRFFRQPRSPSTTGSATSCSRTR